MTLISRRKNSVERSQSEKLPRIGITMGDPAGIGPEIILKALIDKTLVKTCVPIIVGDFQFLKKSARKLDTKLEIINILEDDSKLADGGIGVYPVGNLKPNFPTGVESGFAGKASGEYIEKAVDLWKNKKLDAIVTAPINKKSFEAGGYDFPGHTEFIAKLTDTKEFAMSFFARQLCVVLLSTHLSLRDALDRVKKENLVKLIRFTDRELSRLLNRKVKIAVAGLNPHASEQGMFGDEEESEIAPAVVECIEQHDIDVSGPYSPDTIFVRGYEGEFDAVVSCYHDQATIAVKCLSFGAAVNVTLGLPLIRTSVDHGTAYDIVGANKADCSSLKAAIKLAVKLVPLSKTT